MQVWLAALYVLAGFADGERPRRPRSSWVFGRGQHLATRYSLSCRSKRTTERGFIVFRLLVFFLLFGCVGSEGTDALRQAWGVGVSFALPSFHVIDEILDIVERDNATIILSVPAWISRPWWTRLWSAA